MSRPDYDVAIVGGGVVGAALAALLVRQARIDPQRVLLVERELEDGGTIAPPAADAPFDLRVWALSQASRNVLHAAGAYDLLDSTRLQPYEAMRVWHEGSAAQSRDALRFEAAAVGAVDLGVIVENRAVQAALMSACIAVGVLPQRDALVSLTQSDAAVQLQLQSRQCTAALLIGADGAASRVRQLAGITSTERSYGQQAIVANLQCELPHQQTAWQVFLDTGPLALLPLPGNHCSLVWSMVDAQVQQLLDLSADEFSAALTRASGGVLGRLQLTGARAHFPLRRLSAQRYVAGRCVLVGDAAHVIHPLAGQGVNQGLLDAAALCEALAQRPPQEDVGALRLLRRYERGRRSGNALVGGLMDALDHLLSRPPDMAGRLAREGMGMVARSALLRQWFARQAMGTAGETPAAARGVFS